MTLSRADRLYRVWLDRELGRITLEQAWERYEEVLNRPENKLPDPSKRCRGCGGEFDAATPRCRACTRRHQMRVARAAA